MRIGECLEYGWETFKRHTAGLVLTALALLVASMCAQLLLGIVFKRFGGWLFSMALSGLFTGGMMLCARKASAGQTPTLEDAFAPFRARQGDYVLVGLAIDAGVILCGVGVLVTSFVFLFAPLCVVDGLDFKQALLRSKDLMFANVAQGVVLCLVLAALNLVGAIACGVGLLATIPISALAVIKAFEQVTELAVLPSDATGPVDPGPA